MLELNQCPVCKSEDFKQILQAKDYTVSGEIFKIQGCGNCGFRFTSPVPGEAEIGPYYKSEEYISHTNTSKGFINNVYQKVRNYTLKSKQRLVNKVTGKPAGDLLDIGCGTGDFLNQMKGAGWSVKGLEPDPDARKLAIDRFGLEVQSSEKLFELEPGQFDAITMWHVLEHVHQLDAYMETIHKLLKPGGILIIAVPNFNSVDAEKYGAGWAAYDVPRHLYHFHKPSMNHLLDRTGFRLQQIRIMPFDSFYVSMLSEKYKNGSMIAGVFNGFLSWVTAVFKNERCSSIIYISGKQH